MRLLRCSYASTFPHPSECRLSLPTLPVVGATTRRVRQPISSPVLHQWTAAAWRSCARVPHYMLQIGPGSVRYSTLCILRYRLLLADTLSRIRCAAFGAHVAALRGSHALQFSRINHTYAISHRIPDRALSSSIALRLRW